MGTKKNSILIISSEFPPGPGGIGNHAYNLGLYFTAEGYAVTVVADVNNTSTEELELFQSSLPFTFKAIVRRKINAATYLTRIATAIAAAAQCHFIICSGKFSLWMVSALKILFPFKKYIAVVHGTELDLKNSRAKKLTNLSLRKFNAIVSVSSYTQSFLPALKAGTQTLIIPNGINNKEFAPFLNTNAPRQYTTTGVLPVITIGNVTERKGQENVIRALPVLLKAFPQLHYHIAGKPTEKQQLLMLSEELKVADHITFHGMLPRNQLIALLADCAVKFMLSNHTKDGDFEGFGIAILEANALGIPAIGANFGGITDAINDDVTGKLVAVNDAQQIAASLQQIVASYSSYSANALQWAQNHDWAILIKQYTGLLQQLG